jgi:thymidine phosphorylase
VLPQAGRVETVRATQDGFLARLRAWPVGQASMLLGAGRQTVESTIDPAAGIVLHRKVGDTVAVGDVIAELHVNEPFATALPAARDLLASAIEITAAPPRPQPLILDRECSS